MDTTLTMIFVVILRGQQGIRGVATWIAEQCRRLGRHFKLKNCGVPRDGTVRRMLAALAVSDLEILFRQRIK